jgi:Ni/Fe-hydrogenase subunit HybB-like protein
MATGPFLRTELPQGVGRITRSWVLFFGATLAVVVVALVAYGRQLSEGLVVTGMRDLGPMQGSAWGLYVALDVYFVGVSFAGITVAAVIRLFDIGKLKSLARMAELLTIVSLLLAGMAIMADLGQPLRGFVNLFRYGRPQSPFFGTFALVIAGYLFSSLVYLYLTSRPDAARLAQRPSKLQGLFRLWAAGYEDTPEQRERHRRTSFWLALTIIPLLIVAHSTLGFVFGLQVGRPGWFGSLQGPAFVVLAGVSGMGLLIVMAAIVRKAVNAEDRVGMDAFAWLGRFLMLLLFAYLYFVVVEVLTTIYQPSVAEQQLSEALLAGHYAWIFWGSVAALVFPALALAWMAMTRSWRLGWLIAAGALVNIGAIGKRYLIVVPSQTHGQLLPYGIGSYSPTWVEFTITAGLFALGALLMAVFMKAFPIIELEDEPEEVAT